MVTSWNLHMLLISKKGTSSFFSQFKRTVQTSMNLIDKKIWAEKELFLDLHESILNHMIHMSLRKIKK